MRLGPDGGPMLTLRPRDYQHPRRVASGVRDWDANWLIVDGGVTEGDRSWQFRQPCITTWEAARLSRWLRAVAGGAIAPTAPGGEPPALADTQHDGLLVLTEPTVAFSLAGASGDEVTLRVHLALEARPPAGSAYANDSFEYVLTVHLSATDLLDAAEVWDRECAAFPAR